MKIGIDPKDGKEVNCCCSFNSNGLFFKVYKNHKLILQKEKLSLEELKELLAEFSVQD